MLHVLDRVPAHIRYPGLVLIFLGSSVLSQVFLFRAAFSGEGLQVEQDYYQKALRFEAQQREQDRLAQAGLTLSLEQISPDQWELTLVPMRQDATRVTLLGGKVEAYRPHLAQAQLTLPLARRADKPGALTFHAPLHAQPGVWDLHLSLEHDQGAPFMLKHRHETDPKPDAATPEAERADRPSPHPLVRP